MHGDHLDRPGPQRRRDPHPQLAPRAPLGKSLLQPRQPTCARLLQHRLARHLCRRSPSRVAMAAEDTQITSSIHADLPEGHSCSMICVIAFARITRFRFTIFCASSAAGLNFLTIRPLEPAIHRSDFQPASRKIPRGLHRPLVVYAFRRCSSPSSVGFAQPVTPRHGDACSGRNSTSIDRG